jgi:plasmid stability protein
VASITVRNLDEGLKARLRRRAAHRGRSVEEEVREILRTTLAAGEDLGPDLAAAVRQRFEPLGGVDLEVPRREPLREPPDFAR